MKKFLFIAVIIGLLLPHSVMADTNTYVKGNVGLFMLEDSDISFEGELASADIGSVRTETGFGLSAAVGRSFGNFDMELEFAFREANLHKFKAKAFNIDGIDFIYPDEVLDGTGTFKTLMTNGIYNFKNKTTVTPYIGGGLGVSWIDVEDFDGTEFAYQFLAGMDMAINNNFSFLLGYRYIGVSDISKSQLRSIEYEGETFTDSGEDFATIASHNIEAGLKYSF